MRYGSSFEVRRGKGKFRNQTFVSEPLTILEEPAEPLHLRFLKGDKPVNEKPFNDTSYEEFLNEMKIMGSKCKKCGALAFPPRPICVSCFGREMEWMRFKGTGKLVAFTCITVSPPSMVKEGF